MPWVIGYLLVHDDKFYYLAVAGSILLRLTLVPASDSFCRAESHPVIVYRLLPAGNPVQEALLQAAEHRYRDELRGPRDPTRTDIVALRAKECIIVNHSNPFADTLIYAYIDFNIRSGPGGPGYRRDSYSIRL